jgi:transcriptional regulator with XRE-family HTH domain
MQTRDYDKRYSLFRKKLRQARVGAGLTQIEAARRLGITQSVLSKCERGERRVDVVELAEFAKIYGKPLSYFAEAKDP